MHMISNITESLRLAEHYAAEALVAGEVEDNRAGFVRLNLLVIQYASHAEGQIYLVQETLRTAGVLSTLDQPGTRPLHKLVIEAFALSQVARQAIIDCL